MGKIISKSNTGTVTAETETRKPIDLYKERVLGPNGSLDDLSICWAEDYINLYKQQVLNRSLAPDLIYGPKASINDWYIDVVIHTERARHKFSKDMKRHEMYDVYMKVPPNSICLEKIEDLFYPNYATESNFPRRILVTGRPGIGKTVLTEKILRDWASDVDEYYSDKIAFFFKFRWFNIEELTNISLKTFLRYGTKLDEEKFERIYEEIVKVPQKAILIFDGLDEFHGNLDQSRRIPNNSNTSMSAMNLFIKLVLGDMLKGATVLVTSRPTADYFYSKLDFDRNVEIIGFTSDKIEEYVTRFCDNNNTSDLKPEIWNHIKSSSELLNLCYIPVNCFIVCVTLSGCLSDPRNDSDALPTTLTELYQRAIDHFEKHHQRNERGNSAAQEALKELQRLAFLGMENGQLVFYQESFDEEMKGSGLLNSLSNPIFPIQTQFCFIHLTIQEFLAALHVTETLTPPEIKEFISNHMGMGKWHLVLQFIAGLLGKKIKFLGKEYGDCVLAFAESFEVTHGKVELNNNQVFVMKCLREVDDEEIAKYVCETTAMNDVVKLVDPGISLSDWAAVIFVCKYMKNLATVELNRNANHLQAVVEFLRKTCVNQLTFTYHTLGCDEEPIIDQDVMVETSSTSNDAYLQEEAVNIVEKTDIENRSIGDDRIASAEQLLITGLSHEREGRNEEAIKSYEQAVQIADETDRNDIKTKAYQHLANVFAGTSEYKKAIEFYQKAREISPDLEANEMEVIVYQWFGFDHLQAGQYQESIEYYHQVVKYASQLGDKTRIINAYLGLGSAFSHTGEFEFSQEYFLKALPVTEQLDDKILQKEVYTNLGAVYYKSCKFVEAVKSYLKVQEISHDLGERKEEANACLMLGDTFQELKQHEEGIDSYQKTFNISKELGDREMQVVAIQRLGTLYLTLAADCCKNWDYKKARTWYEFALDISRKEPNDHRLLHEKALTGLGTSWLSLGNTEKAMESFQKAEEFAKDTKTDSPDIETTHEHTNSTEQKASSSSGAPGSRERVEEIMEQACNSSRTDALPMEDLVLIKKYIEISASYVYTRQISIKEPFTKKTREVMTENVKASAYASFLGKNDDKLQGNNVKFDNRDKQVFNFARSEVFKNASTQKRAKLNIDLVSLYMKSIGQIVCGGVPCGTCFLVGDALVITNYHVYRMTIDERNKLGNPNLPITVQFDYLDPGQTEHIITAEVDEERDTTLENPYLDYKFFRLKQNEGLNDRVPLGPMVRNWQLSDGRVIILGHPEGKEMQEEVCLVVGYRTMHETIRKRHQEFTGVHMTNAQLLHKTERYQGCLSYDTTLFNGASGSPVIEMSGNIVAMHTQGYLLNRGEENIPNQQGNIPNQEQGNIRNHEQRNIPNHKQGNIPNNEQGNIPNQEQGNILNHEQGNIPNHEQGNILNHEQGNIPTQRLRTYSLMEFGVQFIEIYRDMIQWHNENFVKEIFPNLDLLRDQEPMDTT